MAEYDLPMTGLRQRPSNTMPTLRNVRIAAGDDFTITATLYATEDSANADPINGTAYVSFFDLESWGGNWGWNQWSSFEWDYGSLGWGRYIPPSPILQVQGAYGADVGSFVFAIGPAMTQLWRGRYAFFIQLSNTGAGAVVIRGIMDVETGITFPGAVVTPFILDTSLLDGPDSLG